MFWSSGSRRWKAASAPWRVASGQQAITVAMLNLCHSSGHIVSAAALYGGTITLFGQTFKRLGIEVTFVDATDPQNIAKAIRPNTKAVYIESLANPKNDVLDYRAIADAAHAAGLPVVCDNTVTPLLLRPFDHGIDIVVYSLTKFIGGHGTSIGGAIIDSGRFDWARQPEIGRSSTSRTPRTTARFSTRRWANCATSSRAARTGSATWAAS